MGMLSHLNKHLVKVRERLWCWLNSKTIIIQKETNKQKKINRPEAQDKSFTFLKFQPTPRTFSNFAQSVFCTL